MAYGNQQKTNNNLKAYAFKIKSKDLPAPEFEVKSRNADGKFELIKADAPVTNVRGNLIGLDVKSFDFEGDKIKSVQLTLQDDKEIDFVTLPTTQIGRSVMNSLLNLTAFDNISISLYQTKPKTDGGKTFGAASVRQNDEIVRWKYSLDETPKSKVVGELKGKKIIDWSPVDDFFLNAVAALGERVKNQTPVTPNPKASPPAEKHDDDTTSEVPF